MPRILHVASGDLWAGAEAQLFTLVKTLYQQLDVPVSVVLLNHGALEHKLKAAYIPVIVLDESKLNGFQILYRLYRTIKEQKPDVIHTHRIKENILGSIAGLLAAHAASVRTLHGAPEHPPKWWQIPRLTTHLIDWFCGRFIQKRIFLVTGTLAGIVCHRYPTRMISVIENGLDTESLLSHRDRNDKYFSGNKEFIEIGLAGRLVPVKRVDLFIQMAHHLLKQHPKVKYRFRIFGDGPLKEQLNKLSEQLEVTNSVSFEGHCDNISSHLDELDILVMTSDSEGLPMILLEAMSKRVPIIAHAVGGIPNLLDHGKCGFLVSDHSPEGYAGAVLQIIGNPELQRILSERAFDRVKQQYSATANASAYLAEYSEVRSKR